jgi:circadian clock protein KaiB
VYATRGAATMRLTGRNIRSTFERAAESIDTGRYVLKLYVTGNTARSTQAVENLRAICDEYLEGRYDLEVIDIYQQPALLAGEQIVAAPTLVKRFPLPVRRLVGDMSNRRRVIVGLDLVRHPGAGE